jgi:arylsulfatase A-like enzyme
MNNKILNKVSLLLALLYVAVPDFISAQQPKPNILFIAVDDLNDWIGCMGGHPQTITPNLDRLAKSSMFFTNAHCSAPACNPSRTAVFTGISPHRSGLYSNNQKMREIMPEVELLPKTLSRQGYYSAGSGKMLHYFIDAQSWDEYFPKAESENPFPRTLYPEKRPLSLPRGGPWQYIETDWGPLQANDQEYGGDYLVAEWISKKLAVKHDKPFFLACGIYRPHEPWFVPEKYFKPFPLESIQRPSGYKADDLDDLPAEGQRRGPNRYFAHIQKEGQWEQAIQGYLASIHFADAMVGKVLDALAASPYADNTIVVLWSDHGWHLGEKQHWQKFTGWRVSTRVPLMIRTPAGKPGVCARPVSLTSLSPTLLDLAGLPAIKQHDSPSLVPLLNRSDAKWPHVAITDLEEPGSFSVSDERWRYIRYKTGGEELYHNQSDPHEWLNLAESTAHAVQLEKYRELSPKKFVPKPDPNVSSLPRLKVIPSSIAKTPGSMPDGNPFDVVFVNQSSAAIRIYWMDQKAKPKFYFEVEAGQYKRQQTRPGAVWFVADKDGADIGYVKMDDRSARVVIVKQ